MGAVDSCLDLNMLNHVGQGDSWFLLPEIRESSEIADGLEMNSPDMGGAPHAKPDNLAHLGVVHPRYQGGNQHNADILFLTEVYDPFLYTLEFFPPQLQVNPVIHPIKL